MQFATYAEFDQYDASGNIINKTYGNGVATQYTYSPIGQLTGIDINKNDSTYHQVRYNWNQIGQIESITDLANDQNSQSYNYDKIGRLIEANGPFGKERYSYDRSGNRIMHNDVSYLYDGYQAILGSTEENDSIFTARYDASGNMIRRTLEDEELELNYDGNNQLLSVLNDNKNILRFAYDYQGSRILKFDSLRNILTLNLFGLYEITQYGSDSISHTKYIPGVEGNLAAVTHTMSFTNAQVVNDSIYFGNPTDGILYFHQSRSQSTSLTTDQNGDVSTIMSYYPFGEVYRKQTFGPNNFRAKFNGKELDIGSGLYYFNARYYDPVVSRFVSADTRPGGGFSNNDIFNQYAFAVNTL